MVLLKMSFHVKFKWEPVVVFEPLPIFEKNLGYAGTRFLSIKNI